MCQDLGKAQIRTSPYTPTMTLPTNSPSTARSKNTCSVIFGAEEAKPGAISVIKVSAANAGKTGAHASKAVASKVSRRDGIDFGFGTFSEPPSDRAWNVEARRVVRLVRHREPRGAETAATLEGAVAGDAIGTDGRGTGCGREELWRSLSLPELPAGKDFLRPKNFFGRVFAFPGSHDAQPHAHDTHTYRDVFRRCARFDNSRVKAKARARYLCGRGHPGPSQRYRRHSHSQC